MASKLARTSQYSSRTCPSQPMSAMKRSLLNLNLTLFTIFCTVQRWPPAPPSMRLWSVLSVFTLNTLVCFYSYWLLGLEGTPATLSNRTTFDFYVCVNRKVVQPAISTGAVHCERDVDETPPLRMCLLGGLSTALRSTLISNWFTSYLNTPQPS